MRHSKTTKANEVVADQARHWIVEIDAGNLSPTDEARFTRWLNESPAHRQTFEELRHKWRRLDAMQRLRTVSADPTVVDRWVRNRTSRRALGRFAIAAGLAALACGVWFMQAPSVHEVEYRTAVGEQRIVPLPDDSIMTLNTDTRVRVHYSDEERRIELQRGEALFEVAMQSGRPFVVAAGSGVVRAVGTAFTVYLRTDVVDVTVTEGAVEVSGAAEPVAAPSGPAFPARVLTESHKLRYQKNVVETVTVSAEELRRALAWRHGMLDFEAAPLSDVITEANRYIRDRFVIVDPELETLEFTGYFRAGDVGLLVKLLESNDILRTTRVDYRTVHVTKAPAAQMTQPY